MHNLENLKDKLCRELDEYASRGKMDMNTLQIIDTIAHTVKNLNKIIECDEKEKYSEGPRVHGNYSFGDNYNSGYNYNNRNMGDWRMDPYSMAGRYATGNDVMIQKLRDLMNDTHDSAMRDEFRRFIEKMERM
jgi:hypothetical protein